MPDFIAEPYWDDVDEPEPLTEQELFEDLAHERQEAEMEAGAYDDEVANDRAYGLRYSYFAESDEYDPNRVSAGERWAHPEVDGRTPKPAPERIL